MSIKTYKTPEVGKLLDRLGSPEWYEDGDKHKLVYEGGEWFIVRWMRKNWDTGQWHFSRKTVPYVTLCLLRNHLRERLASEKGVPPELADEHWGNFPDGWYEDYDEALLMACAVMEGDCHANTD